MKMDPNLTDAALIQNLKTLVAKERSLAVEILWHLREVEHRRIHLDTGFPSLFDYCTRELGYSAGAAARRIAAMRLLKDIPAIEPKIRSGELNLSQLAQAERFFKEESRQGRALEPESKSDVLEGLVGKSSRECEQWFAEMNPQAAAPDRERILTADLTEIRFVADSQLMQKIQQLKNLQSHRSVNPSYAELFELALDAAIARQSPIRSAAMHCPTSDPKEKSRSKSALGSVVSTSDQSHPKQGAFQSTSGSMRSRTIPVAIRRAVFARDQGRCQFRSEGGRVCSSTFQVQVDHIVPFGQGGTHDLENLHLLCRAHNARKAELDYDQRWSFG